MLVFCGKSNWPECRLLALHKMATSLRNPGRLANKGAPASIAVRPARDTSSPLHE